MQNRPDVDKPSIIICSPNRILTDEDGNKRLEPVSIEHMRSRLNMLPPWNRTWQELCIDGEEIGHARSMASEYAIIKNAEFLFFIDNDVVLLPETLNKLVWLANNYPDYDIFSGVYNTKDSPSYPLIFKGVTEGHGEVFWDWTPGDILKDNIVGCGMGCCLIRVSLLHKMRERHKLSPFFSTLPASETGSGCSEDIFFIQRALKEHGSKVMIDTNLLCGHINMKTGVTYWLDEDTLPARNYYAKYPKELPNEEEQRGEEVGRTVEGNETTSSS